MLYSWHWIVYLIPIGYWNWKSIWVYTLWERKWRNNHGRICTKYPSVHSSHLFFSSLFSMFSSVLQVASPIYLHPHQRYQSSATCTNLEHSHTVLFKPFLTSMALLCSCTWAMFQPLWCHLQIWLEKLWKHMISFLKPAQNYSC